MKFVIDTNVAVVANGRNTHADLQCQIACIEKLESITNRHTLAIDDKGLIFQEYQKHLNFNGQPGTGDIFFKYLFYNQHNKRKVFTCTITPVEDPRKGFSELPDNDLDSSDRKFLAVSVASNATIINATDSDWSEQAFLLRKLGVKVNQLCPQYATK